MATGICYSITEIINDNEISHHFKTNKLHIAIADLFIKIRSPITNHVNKSTSQTDVKVTLLSNPTLFKIDGFIDYELSIYDKLDSSLLIKIMIKTQTYKTNSELEESGSKLTYYQNNTHLKTRNMIQNRIRDWVGNDPGAICVLACLASVNPDHSFWLEQGIQDKTLSLTA